MTYSSRLSSPAALLALGLALAVGLLLLPNHWSSAVKGQAAVILRPGQLCVLWLRENGDRVADRVKSHFDTAAKLAQAERNQQDLARENRRLAAELAIARPRVSSPSEIEQSQQRLLAARCVEARVLGEQARAFLGRHRLLDVGWKSGIQPGTLVIDAPPGLIDQGGGRGLQHGQLVLSQGQIWGKIVDVSRSTSTVRTVTEPGYRDLVQLGSRGPQGILEGNGQPFARISLIEVTEPIAVGDPVYAASAKGILPEPLLYGRVVRVERPVGAAHWEIWMEPAVDPQRPDKVAVLRIEFNPTRVAKR